MNQYMNINRIEFVITKACTSKCKHCSIGRTLDENNLSIDKNAAVSVVEELANLYNIESVMTFGGEPLLYADTVCAIHKKAAGCGIPKRQIITNGYFSKNIDKINAVAKALKDSSTNSILVSVDAFHKEHISLDTVKLFANVLIHENVDGVRLHPAWLVNNEHDNNYNRETKECLKYFENLNIPASKGNNIFPSGNAAVYLSEFFERNPINLEAKCGEAPYTEKLDNVETISVNPNGDICICSFVIGNIMEDSINDIISRYNPYENPYMSALINGGVGKLLVLAEKDGITVDTDQFYSACGVCREVIAQKMRKEKRCS